MVTVMTRTVWAVVALILLFAAILIVVGQKGSHSLPACRVTLVQYDKGATCP